jgi:hypothetical protein
MQRHRFVINRLAQVAAVALFLFPCASYSEESALIGTWKLKSFVREVSGTGERYNQLGERPEGVIGYSSDGRMYALLVAGDRIKPRDDIPTDAERIELFKTMIAYSGTYTADALKVVHHVDISWNGARIGSDQVRFYTLEGDTLTLKTAPNKSPIDGGEGVGVLVFQRIK